MGIVTENEKNTKLVETNMAVSTHRNGWFLVAVGHVIGVTPNQSNHIYIYIFYSRCDTPPAHQREASYDCLKEGLQT